MNALSGHSPQTYDATVPSKIARMAEKFDSALESLNQAKPFAKGPYQDTIFQLAQVLLESNEGLRALYTRAHLFGPYGVFYGGSWEHPEKLRPELVKGSLLAIGVYPTLESLSELRMLAIAKGHAKNAKVDTKDATRFLEKVIALNFEFVFPTGGTEQQRIQGNPNQESNERLFTLLASELSLESLREDVVSEIEQVIMQRPIMTENVRKMIEMASKIPPPKTPDETHKKLDHFSTAIHGISPLSQDCKDFASYRQALQNADISALEAEAEHFGDILRTTGLSSPNHAILVRFLRRQAPELIAKSLGLNESGQAELAENEKFVHQLIRFAILPSTFRAIYGLAVMLERSLFSRTEIISGINRLIDLDICSEARQTLLAQRPSQDGVTANSILVAGLIMVLGQPLGIGQGKNPTCQSARGISLWSQHAPGYLIELLVSAARDGLIEVPFEGTTIQSNQLENGLMTTIDLDLDPVSLVLVPHLDRVYSALMVQVALRNEDGHKWVNPALYGRWVSSGFSSVFDLQGQVANYEDFVRRFFSTHHPTFNDGYELMYPNPVGLLITNTHADLLGMHAVSIQRISQDPKGQLRIYFYNPNNEGRQDWGQEIQPSVYENGEEEGESSLPFNQFVSRLYAFHYNPYEEGDGFAVPTQVVREIETLAKESWGRTYTWK